MTGERRNTLALHTRNILSTKYGWHDTRNNLSISKAANPLQNRPPGCLEIIANNGRSHTSCGRPCCCQWYPNPMQTDFIHLPDHPGVRDCPGVNPHGDSSIGCFHAIFCCILIFRCLLHFYHPLFYRAHSRREICVTKYPDSPECRHKSHVQNSEDRMKAVPHRMDWSKNPFPPVRPASWYAAEHINSDWCGPLG